MNTVVKVRGSCKWFNEQKGFGFLICENYPFDVFVHKQQLDKSGVKELKEGDKITCVVSQGIKGHYATNITKE